MIKNLAVAIGGLLVIAVVYGFWIQFNPQGGLGPYQACTAEAKICPDGTAVGRSGPNCEFAACPEIQAGSDYKNATYILGGESVTLSNGASATTKVFGAPTVGDLNGDGVPDSAFLLVQNPGGSGTFYHLVVALSVSGGVQGTNGLLLGDRVAPQTVEIKKDGLIVANYADRKPTDPMVVAPSVGISKYARIINGTLIQIQQPGASVGTVLGRVTLSPTCPVERIPPDPQCAPKGYATTVSAMNGPTVVTAASDDTGAFTLSLNPGTYTLSAKGGNTLPRCQEGQSVIVVAGKTQTVAISCDTGIR